MALGDTLMASKHKYLSAQIQCGQMTCEARAVAVAVAAAAAAAAGGRPRRQKDTAEGEEELWR
jgi:hypothetical protein